MAESNQRAAQGRKKRQECEMSTYRNAGVPSGFRARPRAGGRGLRSGNAVSADAGHSAALLVAGL